MREIKFRFWDRKFAKMGQLGVSDYYKGNELILTMAGEIYYFEDMSQENLHREKDRFVVMQFTGLKDKNGKEIYEGDIVKCGEFGTYVIKYHNGAFLPLDINDIGMGQIVPYREEIIGNIYENSDLLTPKSQ